MKNLLRLRTPPAYFDVHANIVASKSNPRRARLEALADSVQRRFGEYDAAVANDTLAAINEDATLQNSESDFWHCYEVKTAALKNMLDCIDESQRDGALKWCPYCGITAPMSFDHYLPKETFPEFSVDPQNLIRSCTKCNSTKGSRWISAGDRLFIHFYYDLIPEEQFLFVDIDHEEKAFSARFFIEKPEGVALASWGIIENHFRKLDLLKEYRENANNEFSSAINICASHLKNGGKNIAAFLVDLVGQEEQLFGRNHWRNVLLRALASDTNFANEVALRVDMGL